VETAWEKRWREVAQTGHITQGLMAQTGHITQGLMAGNDLNFQKLNLAAGREGIREQEWKWEAGGAGCGQAER
jgi:hypothetical protein